MHELPPLTRRQLPPNHEAYAIKLRNSNKRLTLISEVPVIHASGLKSFAEPGPVSGSTAMQ